MNKKRERPGLSLSLHLVACLTGNESIKVDHFSVMAVDKAISFFIGTMTSPLEETDASDDPSAVVHGDHVSLTCKRSYMRIYVKGVTISMKLTCMLNL